MTLFPQRNNFLFQTFCLSLSKEELLDIVSICNIYKNLSSKMRTSVLDHNHGQTMEKLHVMINSNTNMFSFYIDRLKF